MQRKEEASSPFLPMHALKISSFAPKNWHLQRRLACVAGVRKGREGNKGVRAHAPKFPLPLPLLTPATQAIHKLAAQMVCFILLELKFSCITMTGGVFLTIRGNNLVSPGMGHQVCQCGCLKMPFLSCYGGACDQEKVTRKVFAIFYD